MHTKYIVLIAALSMIFTACGTAAPHPISTPATIETQPTPTSLPPTAMPDPASIDSAQTWKEYRDARYGYGLALPCYWSVIPTPMLGMFATMSAHSYSEEFFQSNSDRGNWIGEQWPAGAINLNVMVIEEIDPSIRTVDAIRQFYAMYSSEQTLLSVDEVSFDHRVGYVATLTGGPQGSETVRTVFFTIDPEALAAFTLFPSTALDSSDAQAILRSFVPSTDEAVSFPAQNPSGPPGGGSMSCS